MNLTPQQQAFVDAIGTNTSVRLDSVAGSGKTTTLAQALHSHPRLPAMTLAIAFNVATKKAFESRLPSGVTCMTLNGLGHRTISQNLRTRVSLDTDKTFRIAKSFDLPWNLTTEVRAAIDEARQRGFVSERYRLQGTPIEQNIGSFLEANLFPEEIGEYVIEGLRTSIREALGGTIDFTDQIYLPLAAGMKFPKFTSVFVDEAQDLSSANHQMILGTRPSHLSIIGDPFQSIYAFRGAAHGSMDLLSELFPMKEMRLSVSFRCSRAVIRHAQQWVPHIEPRPDAPEGSVEMMQFNEIDWTQPTTVLCRFNAPLFSVFYRLLRQRIPATMPGMKGDRSLIRLISRASHNNDSFPISSLLSALDDIRIAKPQHADAVSALNVIAQESEVRTAGALKAEVKSIFERERGVVELSSIHKAKGLEWPRVVWLNPTASPTWFQLSPEDHQQERNLRYVATTRAQNDLIMTELPK